MLIPDKPTPFLITRAEFIDLHSGCTGLCVGYELGHWRRDQFADHVLDWLLEYALSPDEQVDHRISNGYRYLRRAAMTLYTSDRYKSRGDFGELLLHICLRQVFNSNPVIRKIYFKSATNDYPKGFDAVHVVERDGDTELWLGEAKFYADVRTAARDALKSLSDHSESDFLREEFLLISNKIPADHPSRELLDELLDINMSLDEVFKSVCYPVLITYDSSVVQSHTAVTDEYKEKFESEIKTHYEYFAEKFSDAGLPPVRFHLFLIPLNIKSEIATALDERLKALSGETRGS